MIPVEPLPLSPAPPTPKENRTTTTKSKLFVHLFLRGGGGKLTNGNKKFQTDKSEGTEGKDITNTEQVFGWSDRHRRSGGKLQSSSCDYNFTIQRPSSLDSQVGYWVVSHLWASCAVRAAVCASNVLRICSSLISSMGVTCQIRSPPEAPASLKTGDKTGTCPSAIALFSRCANDRGYRKLKSWFSANFWFWGFFFFFRVSFYWYRLKG